jgi:hypothetical protein
MLTRSQVGEPGPVGPTSLIGLHISILRCGSTTLKLAVTRFDEANEVYLPTVPLVRSKQIVAHSEALRSILPYRSLCNTGRTRNARNQDNSAAGTLRKEMPIESKNTNGTDSPSAL